jgi:uncharacterized protein (DUF934 family)
MTQNPIDLIQSHGAEQSWILVRNTEDARVRDSYLVIPLPLWLENRDRYANRVDIAIWLDSHEEPESIASDLAHFRFIALNFPSYQDGRAYSSASVLRGKLGYQGQLHAIGDVRPDQLEEMLRCGFDVFHREDGQLLESSQASRFSYQYQASADKSLPLFRAMQLASVD